MTLFHLQMTPNIFDVISSLMNSNFVTNYLTSTVLVIASYIVTNTSNQMKLY